MDQDIEKKKEFLSSYLEARRAVARLEEQLEELKQHKLSPGSPVYDGMPRGNKKTDLSDYAVKMDELEQEIRRARYRRICVFQKVQRSVEAMEDEMEKDLLTYRYLRGLKWEDVTLKMDYSWRKIHYLHGEALKHFKICA